MGRRPLFAIGDLVVARRGTRQRYDDELPRMTTPLHRLEVEAVVGLLGVRVILVGTLDGQRTLLRVAVVKRVHPRHAARQVIPDALELHVTVLVTAFLLEDEAERKVAPHRLLEGVRVDQVVTLVSDLTENGRDVHPLDSKLEFLDVVEGLQPGKGVAFGDLDRAAHANELRATTVLELLGALDGLEPQILGLEVIAAQDAPDLEHRNVPVRDRDVDQDRLRLPVPEPCLGAEDGAGLDLGRVGIPVAENAPRAVGRGRGSLERHLHRRRGIGRRRAVGRHCDSFCLPSLRQDLFADGAGGFHSTR